MKKYFNDHGGQDIFHLRVIVFDVTPSRLVGNWTRNFEFKCFCSKEKVF